MIKKSVLILLAVIGFGFSANAQVCKINGSTDNVEVMSCNIDGNNVVVNVSNDSQDIMANVTISVKVKYSYDGGRSNCGTQTETVTGKARANAGDYTTITISIPSKSGYKPCDAEVTYITGTKCL